MQYILYPKSVRYIHTVFMQMYYIHTHTHFRYPQYGDILSTGDLIASHIMLSFLHLALKTTFLVCLSFSGSAKDVTQTLPMRSPLQL